MRYYVTADIHGFYTPLITALTKAGFFADSAPVSYTHLDVYKRQTMVRSYMSVRLAMDTWRWP